MAFPNTCKLSELSFNSSFASLNHPHSSFRKFPFRTLTFASLPTPKPNPSAPWLTKSPSPKRAVEPLPAGDPTPDRKPQNAVDRIVLRLRNLGLPSEEEEQEQEHEEEIPATNPAPVTGEERLGELLQREWVRPDAVLVGEDDDEEEEMMLPWERDEEEKEVVVVSEEGLLKKRRVRAPSLADLTLEDELLRRLRREGMRVRERVSVPKAGLTQEVMEKIHKRWRKEELVRLKFHEELAKDMRKAHEIVEVQFLPLFHNKHLTLSLTHNIGPRTTIASL